MNMSAMCVAETLVWTVRCDVEVTASRPRRRRRPELATESLYLFERMAAHRSPRERSIGLGASS